MRTGRLTNWAGLAVVAAIVAAMALDTKVVVIGSDEDLQEQVFNPAAFGVAEFPRIRDAIIEKAVDAETLYQAVTEDKAAATGKYGQEASVAPVFPVYFSGTFAEGRSGIFDVKVDGLDDVRIRVQTGPAINGTELRDATGTIEFGQFVNQIEYQDAGAAINNAMKEEVLVDLDRETLPGRAVSVTGAFRLINPKMWLVTPVRMSVE